MKFALSALAVLVCAGCASTSAPVAEQVDLRQKTKVKCVASNFERNGCKTKHELWIVAPFGPAGSGVPSANDLRDPNAGSEF